MITISFGFSVAIKVIINQYMQTEQYNLINALALNSVFKIMLAMIYFYLTIYHEQTYLDFLILSIQNCLLDVISLLIGYYLATKHLKKRISTHMVTVCFLLVVTMGGNLQESQAIFILRVTVLLSVGVTYLISTKWKQVSEDILHEKFPVFKMILIYRIINYLVSYIFTWHVEKYKDIMIIFQVINTFYLLFCAYYVSISSPWEERMHALSLAEEQINEQSRNCDMIVNLSHELKTPVNVIRSALDILVQDFKNTAFIEYIKDIKKECNQVMNIIQDMTDIQKINGGYIEPKYQMYNLVEIVEYVMDAFSEEVVGSNLIFDPQEEEINEVVDGILIQKGFMLLLGLIIQEDATKKLYVTMCEEDEKKRICIGIISPHVPYLEELCRKIHTTSSEELEIEHIANKLTLKLLYAILKLHEGEIVFDKQYDQNSLRIYLKKKEDGLVMRLDNRSVAILTDQIRCRYVGV